MRTMTDEPGTSQSASKPRTCREFERALREILGFSQREAKTIASHGFNALGNEEPADLSGLAALIERIETV